MAEWPSKEEYLKIRCAVDKSKEGHDLLEWASRIERPKNADELAKALASAVLSSGFGYRPAMSVWKKVEARLNANQPLYPVFKNQKKVQAIETIWSERNALFARFKKINSEQDGLAWCEGIPFIRGPALKYQALRDLGAADVAKPDRLMIRIAEMAGESVQGLCRRLSKLSGDRIGTVDVVLWYAASEGILEGISLRRRMVKCRARASHH